MLFKYRARDAGGCLHRGTLAAEQKDTVISNLLERGWAITGLQEVQENHDIMSDWHLFPPVNCADLVLFTRQLSLMLAAGLPILNCLGALERQSGNLYLKKALGNIIGEVKSGSGLAAAVSLHPGIFSPLYISIVKSGEVSGNLDMVLHRLSKHLEMEEAFRSKIKAASAYPALTAALALLILVLVVTWVLPKFTLIFQSAGAALPRSTRWLLEAGSGLKKSLPGAGALMTLLLYAFKRIYKTAEGKGCVDQLIIQMPIAGSLEKQRITARFTGTMSLLLRSGIPVLEAMTIAAETVGNAACQTVITEARQGIRAGNTIAGSLEAAGFFTPMVTDMIAVGEQSGTLDTVMDQLSDYCSSELTASLDSLAKLIEPVLILIVAVLVGGVVISLLLPMLNMVNLVGL